LADLRRGSSREPARGNDGLHIIPAHLNLYGHLAGPFFDISRKGILCRQINE